MLSFSYNEQNSYEKPKEKTFKKGQEDEEKRPARLCIKTQIKALKRTEWQWHVDRALN